jgi:PilZ domain
MRERRVHPRVRVLKSGKIIFGKKTVPCTVRNISEGGVCLQLQTTFGIPATFDFAMTDGPMHHCKVAWLDATRMGVAFC